MEKMSPFIKKDQREEFLAAIDEQGRKHTWVAEKMGITKGYLHNILHNKNRLTEEHRQKLNEILNTNI